MNKPTDKEIEARLNGLGTDLLKLVPRKFKSCPYCLMMKAIGYGEALSWVAYGDDKKWRQKK